ncbi:hypothetical protein [Rarobacter incanus]|uniref:EamA-like transporter family protein n=1 Tax=Rarobacter incanus TaxID=153494 RepID=A0A542SQM4_9MICO|nr:hypothetical protein [Rarobacter incanus]TQK76904.1 hypothetical protein FB389_1606 [Rarobacter incanus]
MIAWAAAIAASLMYGAASVLQAFAARRASGPKVLVSPLYLAGLALDGIAWLTSLVALTEVPLFAVESVLAGSLVITVLLARVFLAARLRRIDWIAIAVIIGSLVVLSLGAGTQPAAAAPTWFGWAMVAAAAAVAGSVAALYRAGHPIALSVAAGLGYGGAAVAARGTSGFAGLSAKGVAGSIGVDGIGTLLGALWQPTIAAIILFAAAGALAFARALERGNVGSVTAVCWVFEVVAPGVAGVVLLGDTVRHGWQAPVIGGLVLALVGCVILARSPAQRAAS